MIGGIGRRGFMKFFGVGAAGAAVSPMVGESRGVGYLGGTAQPMTSSEHPATAAQKAFWAKESESDRKVRYRIGLLEPDLHEMRSISLQHKVRMQFERDEAQRSFFDELRKRLWK